MAPGEPRNFSWLDHSNVPSFDRSIVQKSTEKGARAAPRHDFRRFRVDFRIDFRCFPRLHRASDSTRCVNRFFDVFPSIFRLFAKCENPLKYCACRSKSRFGPSRNEWTRSNEVTSKNNENHTQNLTKIVEKTYRTRFVNKPRDKNSILSLLDATWHRFWSPQRTPGPSRTLFLASRGALWDPPNAPGASRGRHQTLPRRSRDACRALLGVTRCPKRVSGSIFTRFWVPWDLSWGRFHSISG